MKELLLAYSPWTATAFKRDSKLFSTGPINFSTERMRIMESLERLATGTAMILTELQAI